MCGYIYVFKTSVKTEKDIHELKPCLNKLLTLVKWTFDLDDCDKVFRIDSPTEIPEAIISRFLQDKWFECEKLQD